MIKKHKPYFLRRRDGRAVLFGGLVRMILLGFEWIPLEKTVEGYTGGSAIHPVI
ncbi:MAG: hypothetical protein M3Z92_06200 [Bacteroidota bacterium]|nr:hypothetical protein [Bacteroidota bacterium]